MAWVPKAGEMKHVLKFEKVTKPSDETGGRDEDYSEWFTTRGHYKEDSGERSFQKGYDNSVTSGKIWIYWRQAIENELNKDTRIVYNNRVFEIQHSMFVGETRRMFMIEVKEAR